MLGVMLFGLFFIVGHLPNALFEELRVSKQAGNVLVMAFIVGEVYFYLFSPIINLISRYNEFEADKVGAELIGKDALKSALIKLVNENRSFQKSTKIYSIIYHSHPRVLERLEKLQ